MKRPIPPEISKAELPFPRISVGKISDANCKQA